VDLNNHAILQTHPIAPEEINKLSLGWNIALDDKIRYLNNKEFVPASQDKPIDIACRAFAPPEAWIHQLRNPAIEQLTTFSHQFIVANSAQRISQKEYNQELRNSKACISPFGYGEICWRDFEALSFRCLLIKPDMSHVETWPNIYRPYETYLPVKWDFQNLKEICDYYLNHSIEREKISECGHRILKESLQPDQFVSRLNQLFLDESVGHAQI